MNNKLYIFIVIFIFMILISLSWKKIHNLKKKEEFYVDDPDNYLKKVYELGFLGENTFKSCPNFYDQNAQWIWNKPYSNNNSKINDNAVFFYKYMNKTDNNVDIEINLLKKAFVCPNNYENVVLSRRFKFYIYVLMVGEKLMVPLKKV